MTLFESAPFESGGPFTQTNHSMRASDKRKLRGRKKPGTELGKYKTNFDLGSYIINNDYNEHTGTRTSFTSMQKRQSPDLRMSSD